MGQIATALVDAEVTPTIFWLEDRMSIDIIAWLKTIPKRFDPFLVPDVTGILGFFGGNLTEKWREEKIGRRDHDVHLILNLLENLSPESIAICSLKGDDFGGSLEPGRQDAFFMFIHEWKNVSSHFNDRQLDKSRKQLISHAHDFQATYAYNIDKKLNYEMIAKDVDNRPEVVSKINKLAE